MAESGDSRSVQSESKPKIESDGDNDRHDQHSSLVKEMTQKTTDSDSEEDGDNLQSNKNSNAKVDKENDIENKQRPEGVTEELTNRSLVTEQQEDTIHSNTRTITKENIQMDNEPIIERTEGKTEDIIDTSTDIQEQDDSSQFDQNATTEKDIKMDNEPRERTEVTPKTAAGPSDKKEDRMCGLQEDVVTPKTAAGESDQKEDGMTKKDIDTSKDSQQQEDSSRSNTSTRAMEDIHMCSEPKEITKETTEKVTDTSTDTQEQDDSSKSKTSTVTEKDNEPRKRTEERPEEDIYRSTDTQEEEEEDSSQSNTSAMDDKQMDNEPMERTEVTPKTAAGPFDTSPDIKQHEESSQEDMKEDNESIKRKEDIRWWILAGVAIIFAMVCAALYDPDSTPPVQKENNVVELFTEKLNKVESSFPNQRPELWRRSRLHISRHLKTASPTEPVSLILTSGHGAERTLGCLAKRLAEAFSTARNSSVLNIYGKSKSLQDSDQVKLDIDNDLRKAFDGEKLAAVIHRFEELPPGSTLIFYRYCDHENAAYKNVLLVFTVMLDAELEITDNISLGRVEDMVHDQLIRKFVSSDKSALFNQMDVDKLSGLWSRISHLILPVAAEEESIQQGCGLESF